MFLYENRNGFIEDLNSLCAYKKAESLSQASNFTAEDTPDVIQLLTNSNYFDKKLSRSRKRTYDSRVNKFNLDNISSKWKFPENVEFITQSRSRDEESDNDQESPEPKSSSPESVYNFSQQETDEIKINESPRNIESQITQFEESKFIKSGETKRYEKKFNKRMKSVIAYRKKLVINIGKQENKYSIRYDQVKERFNAYNQRLTELLTIFRVYYHLPPKSQLFIRLLMLMKMMQMQLYVIQREI